MRKAAQYAIAMLYTALFFDIVFGAVLAKKKELG